MIHSPILLKDIAISFSHKICFEDFSIHINYGSRIAIIGRNGCGKTTLLKCLQGTMRPTSGLVQLPQNTRIGYVPQIIENDTSLSGGQRFNKAVTRALSLDPNILLLDEPTNHLDRHNRKSLLRMLQSYPGTLIVVTHDTELLRTCIDTLWHIDNGQIHVFTGAYDDYIRELRNRRSSIEQKISLLKRQKKDIHHALMKEQTRAAKSKAKGTKSIHQRKWPTILSPTKVSRAQETSGRKKSAIEEKKQDLSEQLSNLHLPEIIVPKFSLSSTRIGERNILSIRNGCTGYVGFEPLLQKISLSIGSRDRISIQGDNASGKSTLIKAILDDSRVIKSGDWHTPKLEDVGYLDQHYSTLSAQMTVLETIVTLMPTWSHIEVRRHLNDFLFHKNEEVNNSVSQLSGGEKARLALAQIAARTPKLLILDEITNNLDLETKEHVMQVLKAYPGAMIVISHDADFLDQISIETYLKINNGLLLG
ncbi:ABC-F family ATP-binding cassette domain-containing protein [Candidatus Berkiella aquae]|uniref:ATP-binding cassette domain-containing protein n=1 Tax=Candidatus Berkiella aquae TaxID=295108 RepID=A0A0Q9YM26_9GAMM|nr:ATP-binding cassette domain-containing protein [Candidatus Berkiella aquae]MCS5712828.1 ATP-binding cassette domain-containing protein [Candidatus Berkiella aquae]